MAALFGGKTKSEKTAEQQFSAQFTPLIQQQTEASKSALAQAQPLLGKAAGTIDKPLAFWDKLLSGDRGAIGNLLGPELDAVAGRDAAQRQSISQFSPRGTMMNNRLGELDQGTASDINRLFLSVRPEAADQMSQLAQLLFGVGTNLFNASTGASGNALQSLLGQRAGNQQSQALRQQGNSNIFRAANFLWSGAG